MNNNINKPALQLHDTVKTASLASIPSFIGNITEIQIDEFGSAILYKVTSPSGDFGYFFAHELTTVPKINSSAMRLAHKIKHAYTSFRYALLVAYRVLKCKQARLTVLSGISKVSSLLKATPDKLIALQDAWLAIYNLEYLD